MIKKVVFKIEEMDCASCVMSIEGELEDSGNIRSCKVSYAKSQAEVMFEEEKVSEEEIVKIIGQIGYKVTKVTI